MYGGYQEIQGVNIEPTSRRNISESFIKFSDEKSNVQSLYKES